MTTESYIRYAVLARKNSQYWYWDGKKLSDFGHARLYKRKHAAQFVADLKVQEPTAVVEVTVCVGIS